MLSPNIPELRRNQHSLIKIDYITVVELRSAFSEIIIDLGNRRNILRMGIDITVIRLGNMK